MYSPGASTLRVGIYFPGSHVLLFDMIKKKILAPSMFSPGACSLRAGIYFPGSRVLIFAMIKKKSDPSMYSPGAHLLSG